MPGFTETIQRRGISKLLQDISNLGMRYSDKIIKNSQAIGITENRFGYNRDLLNTFGQDDDIYYTFAAMSLTDTNMRQDIAFYDKNYPKRREELRKFALEDEIEDILDTLTDEAIVYDEQNFAARPWYIGTNITDELRDNLEAYYKKIYQYFCFNDGRSMWNFFRKWLIEGYIAFEIIYDDDQKNIIGFKEIDPISLKPGIERGSNKKIYIQYEGQAGKERVLYDSQIIYLSYKSINSSSRVSYLERLIRSYNILRIMEHTRIIWAVTNASFKMKFVIPVGNKSKTRARQSLAQLMHNYREIVDYDYSSGQLMTNGKPMMQFNKEYWMPSKDGETPEIEVLGGEGPELSDTESLKYFHDKLKMASKIPFMRFDKESPADFNMVGEGMARDEIKFSKFINRLRSIFQEILVKPLYIQMILKYPELKDDEAFKAHITIKYNKDNLFEEMKTIELTQKRVDFIGGIKDALSTTDADGNENPYFAMEFLVKKYLNLDEDDIKLNKRYKDITKYEKMGYTHEDSIKIADGEPLKNFKKEKKEGGGEETEMGF